MTYEKVKKSIIFKLINLQQVIRYLLIGPYQQNRAILNQGI